MRGSKRLLCRLLTRVRRVLALTHSDCAPRLCGRVGYTRPVVASATGGDEVHIVGGVVFRNGRETDGPYLTYRSQDNWGPEVVSEGTCFVMGDRRDNSSDSRHWGFVSREYVLGRVTVRWWPLSARRRF